MTTPDMDFKVVPLNILLSELKPNYTENKVEDEKHRICEEILKKSNAQIVASDVGLAPEKKSFILLRKLGSDLNINVFALNFRLKPDRDREWNADVEEANYLMSRVIQRLSVDSPDEAPSSLSLVLTSTMFTKKLYGECAKNFKHHLGLRKDDLGLMVLRNVVMNPFPTEKNFIGRLAGIFKDVVDEEFKVCQKRNSDAPTNHELLLQGQEQFYMTHIPTFHIANHRQQLVLEIDVDPNSKNGYPELKSANPSESIFLETVVPIQLPKLLKTGSHFKASVKTRESGLLLESVTVMIKKVVKSRLFNSRYLDANYPRTFTPFYLYDNSKEKNIDHMLLRSLNRPIFCFQNIYEEPVQPFPENAQLQENSAFWFKTGNKLNVRIYSDAYEPSAKGPGLLKHVGEEKYLLAIGAMALGKGVSIDTETMRREWFNGGRSLIKFGRVVSCAHEGPLMSEYGVKHNKLPSQLRIQTEFRETYPSAIRLFRYPELSTLTMAILHDLPGIKVTVYMNGKPVEEYDDDEEFAPPSRALVANNDGKPIVKTTTKYIESITDQEFSIYIDITNPFKFDCPNIGPTVFIDGFKASRTNILRSDYTSHTVSQVIKGAYERDVRRKIQKFRHFKFSKVETISDDMSSARVKKDAELVQGMGEIVVKFHRKTEPRPEDCPRNRALEAQSLSQVHEKALKGEAKSHNTSYGKAEEMKMAVWTVSKFLDGGDFPMALFRFKYRSKEALKQLHIIERTPEPENHELSAPPSPVGFNDLDGEQRREVERYIRSLKISKYSSTRLQPQHHADLPSAIMAIHDRLPGVKVEILVDKEPLQEYTDDEVHTPAGPNDNGAQKAARTVSKYIEAVTGKEFQVRVTIDDTYKPDCPTLLANVFADGIHLVGRTMRSVKGKMKQTQVVVDGVEHAITARRARLKPFIFSKITTTSDESNSVSIAKQAEQMAKIGEIKVEFHRKGYAKPVASRRVANERPSEVNSPSKVHEKALKGEAKTHGTSLGHGRRATRLRSSTSKYLGNKDLPLAIYTFKYRSKGFLADSFACGNLLILLVAEALKALRIIERTPEPEMHVVSDSESNADLDDLDEEQKAEAKRFIRFLKASHFSPSDQCIC
ncbi:hypothetical protein G7Y89_g11399 [Cudoniella acicularis]|uniref:DUF7918 domain-containing protein n=1 Tax=Cudoniella acicularis TaxID=354080 RepID=A0A8H4VYB5_9HELO|nr:hypothetical protein G7Y89_g11399 [Cudoniella acicularis]